MAFISDISGLRGENLASALLAHLLLRSEPIRRAFVAQISPQSKKGPIIVERHFAVFTEAATDERKRVDILIQTDNAIVGVESKFSAGFQTEQPKSYLKLVETKARSLEDVWHSSFQPLLVVLAPEDREVETVNLIQEQEIAELCIFLSWQQLLKSLNRENLPDLGTIDRFLVTELEQYANSYMGTADLSQLMAHINNPWQKRGSTVVREVFNSVIWPLLNEDFRTHTSYSGGADWHGYYLCNNYENRPWIGFVNRQSTPSGQEGTLFVVALRSEPAANALIKKIRGERLSMWDTYNQYCVNIPYEETWISRNDWKPAIDMINDVIKGTLGDLDSDPD